MSLITNVEHAFAIAIGDIKKIGTFIQSKALPILKDIEAQAPTIEAITGLISPQLSNIERVGDAALAKVIKAIEDAGAAADGGFTLTLDAAFVADVKAIIPAIKSQAAPMIASLPASAK